MNRFVGVKKVFTHEGIFGGFLISFVSYAITDLQPHQQVDTI